MLLVILLSVLNVSMFCLHRNKKVKAFGKTFNRVFSILLFISLLLLGSYDYENCSFLVVAIGLMYPIYIAYNGLKAIYMGKEDII